MLHVVALAMLLGTVTIGMAVPGRAAAALYEGFGAATAGGDGKPVVHVTNLNDSGAGSLRDALAAGNRTVVFDVAGTIALASPIYVKGAFVTIDGSTAPAPGITLKDQGLYIHGRGGEYYSCGSTCYGAHDVIVTGLRIRNAGADGLRVSNGAYNVVLDHVSVHGSLDGNIDITEAHDVTVQWSVLAEPRDVQKNMLIKYGVSRVTLHHNLFVAAQQRNPQVRIDDEGTVATDTTLDMRNNVIWDWRGGYGTLVWHGPRANVVANYYASPASPADEQADAVRVESARAYVSGNISGDGAANVDVAGTETSPFPAPPVTTARACDGAHAVVAGAGVLPLDAVDHGYLDRVILERCGPTTAGNATRPGPAAPVPAAPSDLPDLTIATSSVPGSAAAGATLTLGATTRNAGTAASPASSTRFSLASEEPADAAVVLGTISVPPLAPGASHTGSLTVTVPAGTASGSYRVVAAADGAGAIRESSEGNNATSMPIAIGGVMASPGGDLVVSATALPASARPGATITLSATTRNAGRAPAGASRTRYFLSRDRVLDSGDVSLGSTTIVSLGAGASATVRTTGSIPAATPEGTHYILVKADVTNSVVESNESNNVKVVAITIGRSSPDLVVSSVSAPATARRGTTIAIAHTIRNQGTDQAGVSRVGFYLSRGAARGDDVELGSREVTSLYMGLATTATKTVAIPSTVTAGTYSLLVVADADGAVAESEETNNTGIRTITIR
jgi:hypothetical protein